MKYQQPFGTPDGSPYINGNPATGTQGSIPPAEAIEHPQREIIDYITRGGLNQNSVDLGQLAKSAQLGKINWAIDTGSSNAVEITLNPAPSAYQAGLVVRVKKMAAANSSITPTIDVNGLGPKTLKRRDGIALAANDLPASCVFNAIYDGVDFRLLSMVPSEAIDIVAGLAGFANMYQVYSTGGVYTFTVPPNVKQVFVKLWGAGGGGGGAGATGHGGSGGGGGGFAEKTIKGLVPGTGITVTVGAGGAQATGSAYGGAGGVSSFGAYLSAGGGVGGQYGSTGTYQAATGQIGQVQNNTGATGIGGSLNMFGNRGQQGGICWIANVYGIGGPGGGAPMGGGNGGPPTSSGGNTGTWPGGGGAGAGGGTGSNAISGSGAAGGVVVMWVDPTT